MWLAVRGRKLLSGQASGGRRELAREQPMGAVRLQDG